MVFSVIFMTWWGPFGRVYLVRSISWGINGGSYLSNGFKELTDSGYFCVGLGVPASGTDPQNVDMLFQLENGHVKLVSVLCWHLQWKSPCKDSCQCTGPPRHAVAWPCLHWNSLAAKVGWCSDVCIARAQPHPRRIQNTSQFWSTRPSSEELRPGTFLYSKLMRPQIDLLQCHDNIQTRQAHRCTISAKVRWNRDLLRNITPDWRESCCQKRLSQQWHWVPSNFVEMFFLLSSASKGYSVKADCSVSACIVSVDLRSSLWVWDP